jgi:hypothetical protein
VFGAGVKGTLNACAGKRLKSRTCVITSPLLLDETGDARVMRRRTQAGTAEDKHDDIGERVEQSDFRRLRE